MTGWITTDRLIWVMSQKIQPHLKKNEVVKYSIDSEGNGAFSILDMDTDKEEEFYVHTTSLELDIFLDNMQKENVSFSYVNGVPTVKVIKRAQRKAKSLRSRGQKISKLTLENALDFNQKVKEIKQENEAMFD